MNHRWNGQETDFSEVNVPEEIAAEVRKPALDSGVVLRREKEEVQLLDQVLTC